MTRRLSFAAFLSAGLLTILTMLIPGAQAHNDRRASDCRYASLTGSQAMSPHEAHLTVACAVARMPVPGGVAFADCVISHESGWFERARNSTSSASGYMQILAGSTWPSWTQHFASWRHQHHISANVLAGRPNILVGIRAASQWGWGPWTTAGGC